MCLAGMHRAARWLEHSWLRHALPVNWHLVAAAMHPCDTAPSAAPAIDGDTRCTDGGGFTGRRGWLPAVSGDGWLLMAIAAPRPCDQWAVVAETPLPPRDRLTPLALILVRGLLALLLGVVSLTRGPRPARAEDDPAAWLDPLFTYRMARLHIPGAVFILVKDGQVAYSRGFGFADLERGTPVDPASTVFHAMSDSKPVTATAVMQLVEQGKIRLDADVNTYLRRVKIPQTFPQPITVAELLTHTSGFDYDIEEIGTTARDPDGVKPLAEYLAAHPPARIAPPGEHLLYSNADYDLLGLIVEEVSGQPFPEYVSQHLLQPLGMDHSSFDTRRPASELAKSYRWQDGAFHEMPPHYTNNTAAAGLTTTAADMGRFIMAQLQGGQTPSGGHILQPSTVELMQQKQFAHHADAPGMAYGFFTAQIGSHLSLWHGGWDLYRSRSKLALFPDQHLGYFVAINTARDDGQMIADVSAEIERHYASLPPAPKMPQPPADFATRAARFEGVYRRTEFSHRTTVRAVLLSPEDTGRWVSIEAPGDGTLALRFSPGDAPIRLVEVEPNVFQAAGSYFPVVFLDGSGTASYLTWGTTEYERVRWYETSKVQQRLGLLAALVFLLVALSVPVVGLARRRRWGQTSLARLAGLVAWLVAALNLAFLVGLITTLARAYDIGLEYGMPPVLAGLLVVPVVTTILGAALLVLAVLLWLRRSWSLPGRVAYSAYALMALAFPLFLRYWNLLRLPW
jgi:CubicO group peptidase (beta-lactamase class C family)